MNIVKYCTRELTDKENEIVKHFTYYVDSKSPFGLISDSTVIVMTNEETEGKSDDEIRDDAEMKIDEMLSNYPDFTSFDMDDGYGLVSMMNSIYGVTDKLSDEEIEDGKVELSRALDTRARIIEDCETNGILAVIRP